MMNLIGINGYIGSGKDTIGEIVKELCKEEDGYSPWRIRKFAAKLKQIASLLTGIPAERFEDQEFKKTELGKEWNFDENPMSVRLFLQCLGTEAIRDGLHTNAWVNALFSDYIGRPSPKEGIAAYGAEYMVMKTKEIVRPSTHPELFGEWFPYWLITDTRFPNEAQAIKDRGGIVVRVNRRFETFEDKDYGKVSWIPFPSERHPSETSLDDWKFDYVIDNNGTIEELTERVGEMLAHYKIISYERKESS